MKPVRNPSIDEPLRLRSRPDAFALAVMAATLLAILTVSDIVIVRNLCGWDQRPLQAPIHYVPAEPI
jgi:hypothetical protein